MWVVLYHLTNNFHQKFVLSLLVMLETRVDLHHQNVRVSQNFLLKNALQISFVSFHYLHQRLCRLLLQLCSQKGMDEAALKDEVNQVLFQLHVDDIVESL